MVYKGKKNLAPSSFLNLCSISFSFFLEKLGANCPLLTVNLSCHFSSVLRDRMLLMVEQFWPASVRLLKPAEGRLQDAHGEEFWLSLTWGGLEVTLGVLSSHVHSPSKHNASLHLYAGIFQRHSGLVWGEQRQRRYSKMAEKEPPPLQPAVWEAETSGHPGNGLAQSGQYFSNKHRDSSSALCRTLPVGHAKGE